MVIVRSDLPVRELFPGFRARLVHSGGTTHSWLEADAGAVVGEHSHPHEQVVNVLGGTLELTVNGTVHTLEAGSSFVVQPHVRHAARAVTACSVLDVFTPAREDYR